MAKERTTETAKVTTGNKTPSKSGTTTKTKKEQAQIVVALEALAALPLTMQQQRTRLIDGVKRNRNITQSHSKR